MTTETKKIGRPTKLTPQLQEKICSYIAQGNYLVTACNAVGIDYLTYNNWTKWAEEQADNGGGIYLDFLHATKRAEAQAEASRVARIEASGKTGNWLADMTHLERRHPDRWGRRDRHQVDITEHKTITITEIEVIKDYGGQTPIIEGEKPKQLTPGHKEC